jgi:hypothetical protein
MTININQFEQVPVAGQLDLNINKRGVIEGQVSVNQATALSPGQPVKLDTANTSASPQFVAAAASDVAIGHVVYDVKNSQPTAGQVIGVACNLGPVMFMLAKGTIAPGGRVEQHADGSVQAFTSGKVRGIALDPGVAANLFRVIILTPATALS